MYYPLKIAEQAKEDSSEKMVSLMKEKGHCSADATVEE